MCGTEAAKKNCQKTCNHCRQGNISTYPTHFNIWKVHVGKKNIVIKNYSATSSMPSSNTPVYAESSTAAMTTTTSTPALTPALTIPQTPYITDSNLQDETCWHTGNNSAA